MTEYNKISIRDMMAAAEKAKILEEEQQLKVSGEIKRADIVSMADTIFFDRVVFTFNNNKYANVFFVNDVKDREFSDLSNSNNIKYDSIESALKLDDPTIDGTYLSTSICTDKNYNTVLNHFFIVVDEDVPPGCDILYYLITDDNKTFPIKPNATTPLTLNIAPITFRIKMVIHANGNDRPSIKAFAVLYHDKYIEDGYGLIRPDLSEQVVNNGDNIVTLVRDPLKGDKLVEVISSLDTVKLKYDSQDRLSKVESLDTVSNKKIEENTLVYGDYKNSNGEVEDVLLQIRTKTDFDE